MRRRRLKIFCEVNFFISFVCPFFGVASRSARPDASAYGFLAPIQKCPHTKFNRFLLFRVALFSLYFIFHSFIQFYVCKLLVPLSLYFRGKFCFIFPFRWFLAQNASIKRSRTSYSMPAEIYACEMHDVFSLCHSLLCGERSRIACAPHQQHCMGNCLQYQFACTKANFRFITFVLSFDFLLFFFHYSFICLVTLLQYLHNRLSSWKRAEKKN